MLEKFYTAIDFGELYTKIVRVNVCNDKMYVCCLAKALTKGVRNGEIYSIEEVKSTIQELITEVMKNGSIGELIVVLPSYNLNINRQRIDIKVKNVPTTSEDVRLLQNALSKSRLDENSTAVGVYPIRYYRERFTDLGKVEPIGDRCSSIGLEAFVASLPSVESRAIVSLIESMGIRVCGVYISPIANAVLLLKQAEFKNGAVIIDIGGKGVGISKYSSNLPENYYRTTQGIEFIVENLAKNLGVDKTTARKLLEQYGTSQINDSSEYGVFVNSLDGKNIKEREIVDIIDESLVLILEEVKKKLDLFVQAGQNIPYIITGGGANIDKIADEFSKYLNVTCVNRGYRKVGGRDYSFNACIGALINYLMKNKLIRLD